MTVTKTARIAIRVRCDAGPAVLASLELDPMLVFWPPTGPVIVGGSAGSVMEGLGGNAGNVTEGFEEGNVGCCIIASARSRLFMELTNNGVHDNSLILVRTFSMAHQQRRTVMCVKCAVSVCVCPRALVRMHEYLCVCVCVNEGSQIPGADWFVHLERSTW